MSSPSSSSSSSAVVVLTGAAGALGSDVARAVVARGFKVALVDSPAATERLATLAKELGAGAATFQADLAADRAWDELVPKVERALGAPTHAAMVAGGWQGGTPLHAAKDDDAWRAMMTSNVDTVYRGFRALLPGMVARKRGSIVVVGSRNVERPWTGASAAAYTASKAAAVALAQAVAAEVLPHGVRVNAILPSTMDTPANRKAMPNADFASWVTTASAASVIAFLLSDDARDVSGAVVPVYGRA